MDAPQHTPTKAIGLFFGSFSPIHVGHLIIANTVRQQAKLDEVWFVVSPQSPFKQAQHLMPDHERLHMVDLAIAGNPYLHSCNIEFSLPTPSYTSTTLRELTRRHPEADFSLLMGSDNLEGLHLWHESDYILQHHRILVYRRPHTDTTCPLAQHPSVRLFDLPMLDISSTLVRTMMANGQDVRYLLTEPVWDYLVHKPHLPQ